MAIINSAVCSRRARTLGGAFLATILLVLGTGCSDDDSDGNPFAEPKPSLPPATSSSAGSPDGEQAAEDGADEETPPPGADFWAGKADVAIYLCAKSSPKQDGCANGEVTSSERDAIKADLEKMPEVRALYYESKQEAFQRFKEQNKDSPLAGSLTFDQLPESFRVKLTDSTKEAVVSSAFLGRPGVADVVGPPKPPPTLDPRSSWYGRIDLSVYLCTKSEAKTDGCINGEVTDAERDAIRNELRSMPGVAAVYYESKADAYAELRKTSPELADTIPSEAVPDAFHVKLTDAAKAPVLTSAMNGRPGVQAVTVYA